MLESVLLPLNTNPSAEQAIQLGVQLAQQWKARVRGLTLLDTRRLESVVSACEGAIYASDEFDRLNRREHRQRAVRFRFCQTCLSAGVDFELRSRRANPCEVLVQEARFHDLVLADCPAPGLLRRQPFDEGLTPGELVDLLLRGVQPMLIVRGARPVINRVLLVCNGTPASSRAIRTFFQQGLFAEADKRLLSIGNSESDATKTLAEMADYCSNNRTMLETGYLCGSTRKVLIPYAKKWRADLVVLGVTRGNRMLRRLFGKTAGDILKKSELSLYAVGE